MTTSNVRAPLKVYWQPGCSSCLKTKEFLIANGVEFESINVLEDESGFQELEALGVRLVPIVARGKDWANGAVFRDVARVAGFEWGGHEMLAPAEMVARINTILSAAHRFTSQIAEDKLGTMLPGRPRSYRQLAFHIFQIPDVFLNRVEHDAPYTYESLISHLPPDLETKDDLLNYGAGVQSRLKGWWETAGARNRFRPAWQGLLWRRHPARSARANRLALGPAYAPTHARIGKTRDRAGPTADGRRLRGPADAEEHLGQREDVGLSRWSLCVQW